MTSIDNLSALEDSENREAMDTILRDMFKKVGDGLGKISDAPKRMVLDGRTYCLAFEDEFRGESLDLSKWELCPEGPRQDIGGRWANSEVSVHDGNLWLRARIREDGVPVSGGIRSRGKFEQMRGYFECRMMFPKTTGFWGAFWMMCGDVGKVDGAGVSGSELDIIESGECARRGVNHAIHWDGYGPEHKSVAQFLPNRPDLYDGWHVYALEWTEKDYAFFIDGKETWRTVGGGVCEHPGYLKLTTEFGKWAAPIVPEQLPDFCRVDWVRVWKVENNCRRGNGNGIIVGEEEQ